MIPLPDTTNDFLAGSMYDTPTDSMFAVDFISPPKQKSIYRWDRKTKKFFGAYIEGEENPSFIWPVKGCRDQFIVGFEGVIKLVEWDGISETATVICPLFEAYGHMNYALADRAGRLYFGTINYNTFCSAGNNYALYRYDKGRVTTLINNTITTTGLAIDYKRKKCYVADACEFTINEYDYDPRTGDISKFSLVSK